MSQGWSWDDGDLSMLIHTGVNRSVDSGFVDLTAEAPAETSCPNTRGSRMSTHERIGSTLKILRDGRIFILDLLVKITDLSQMLYSTYRDRMYLPSGTEKQLAGNGRLEMVLDFLWEDPRSHASACPPFNVARMASSWNTHGTMVVAVRMYTSREPFLYQAISERANESSPSIEACPHSLDDRVHVHRSCRVFLLATGHVITLKRALNQSLYRRSASWRAGH
ncbi:hypothetical protein F4604DRAFT_964334 [Suillus subluteus]|nr:hypothetical protein F4604DRAFT_964334 [Suillus subluteus]